MYGQHSIPFKFEFENLIIDVKKVGKKFHYYRKFEDSEVEKIILGGEKNKIIINPVEPMNTPKKITKFFQVVFEKPLVLEPKITRKVFVKFPIEICIFVGDIKEYEVLDILSLIKQKYSLYGDFKFGFICRYYKSDVFNNLHKVNPLHEGFIELNLKNETDEWVQLTKAVFEGRGMKLFYQKDLVGMRAQINITDENLAETYFYNSPIKKGMRKSLELIPMKFVHVGYLKFIMEGDL